MEERRRKVRSSGGLWRSRKDHGAKFGRGCNWGGTFLPKGGC